MVTQPREIRWGFVGTGGIAEEFVAGLASLDGAILQAVASRDPRNAAQFAKKHRFLSHYDSAADLFACPSIDVVYISSPTVSHREHAHLALRNGKAVLCEKPFAPSCDELRKIRDDARSRDLFCMEAMRLRFNPLVVECRRIVQEGILGPVQAISVEMGYMKPPEPHARERAKGAMHRFGCYALSFVHFLLGSPARLAADVTFDEEGADLSAAIQLFYPNCIARLLVTMRGRTSNEATIVGPLGSVLLKAPFLDPQHMRVDVVGGAQESSRCLKAAPRAGLRGEAVETIRCLQAGLLESPSMSLADSLAIQNLLDAVLATKDNGPTA
ncbi:MAG: hypothetical protein A2289_25915 [Deltaproteobacteria bacterium RIFOXYA12_FULL_58_15]|nr:MAG: hypothetical protein A2289_25915 [Deltaproteobacteria bacterium RIFOXYA12_FULL_58_15]OGR11655.1 MAG: hypothetical protein A2341_02780 [Deltaproteobacteria bacterium RIFOXYB12_FULL_58_9]